MATVLAGSAQRRQAEAERVVRQNLELFKRLQVREELRCCKLLFYWRGELPRMRPSLGYAEEWSPGGQ